MDISLSSLKKKNKKKNLLYVRLKGFFFLLTEGKSFQSLLKKNVLGISRKEIW